MRTRSFLPILAILALALVLLIYQLLHAHRVNGELGFPLDDPWIHLQFAKNLNEHGTFSYFRDEVVTSGSTSPLYTALLAVGFYLTNDEMILSYVLGMLFLLAGGFFASRIMLHLSSNTWIVGGAAAALVLFEPRLQWAALSGMETTLFIALLLAGMDYYVRRKAVHLGIALGLLLWSRPEALIFVGALAADFVYRNWVVTKQEGKKKTRPRPESLSSVKLPIGLFLLFGFLYVAFNLWLSGSIFPNTYAAKIKYYSGGGHDYPRQVFEFLTSGHLSILSLFVGVGIISTVLQVVRRRPTEYILPIVWSSGMFLAYWMNLPYLYQEGRYLMPILPFVIIVGLYGIGVVLDIARKRVVILQGQRFMKIAMIVVYLIVAAQFARAAWEGRIRYAESCRYISERQVRTAHWLRENVPPNAIVATHDVGALAFYSQRRIVDMVGLISPEMIENIGSLDRLRQFLVRNNTTHVAVLRNWFYIVNQNPIFQTDEARPEIMEIFEFDPSRTHFTPQNVGRMTDAGAYYVTVGNLAQARLLLDQSLRIDARSSKTRYWSGRAYLAAGEIDNARREFELALQLHPGYWDAQFSLAEIAIRRNEPREAITILESLIASNPRHRSSYHALAHVYQQFMGDSVRAEEYLSMYQQLTAGSGK